MRGHNPCKISLDRGPEWDQLNFIQADAIVRDLWQIDVRIDACVTVTREVFAKGKHAIFLQAAPKGGPIFGHFGRV